MGKNNRFMRDIGAPPGVGAPRPGAPGLGMLPGMPAPPGIPSGIQAPPGSSVTKMTEIDGLRFRLVKMDEQMLKLQEEKVAAEEQILKARRENIELRRQLIAMSMKEVFEKVGIETNDQVSLRDGEYYRIRPPVQQPAQPPAPTRPPDLKLVRDENGGETIVPKEPPAEPTTPEPPAPEQVN